MRFEGTLISWNEERGFGFIQPMRGGQEIFAHAKAFGPRGMRPKIGQLLSFEMETGQQGKKRAKNVLFARPAVTSKNGHRDSSAQSGTATLLAIPAFGVMYLAVQLALRPPLVMALLYLAASLITFFAYARDKSAAQNGRWRIAESTLHLLAVAGGWPGALLAQQLLRHKSRKAEFRAAFWGTVLINIAGFLVICSPLGKPFLAVLR
jgi:uncharacterized membrane protein YsdA (DUF1294 family)/cold shock CspA family protein